MLPTISGECTPAWAFDPAPTALRAVGMLRVIHGRTVVHGRIIETDGAGHAVAKLRAVLDVVHAGDGVMTAEQIGGVVARITMPRRRIGRGRPTEGESG